MRRLRGKRPGHATIAAYLALFFTLTAGAMAAATIDSGDVVNGSLKSVDLKNNAGVKGSDVRNSSLRGGDVGPLRGGQVADNSLGGADANEPTLALSQRIALLGATTNFALPTPVALPFPNNTYTQAAEESNVWIAGGQVTFSAACTQPRSIQVYLFEGGAAPTVDNVAGSAVIQDNSAGAVTRRFTFSSFAGGKGLSQVRTGAPVTRTFYAFGLANCNSGSGVTLDSVGIDVFAER